MPFASGSELGDALTMTCWDRAVRQAREARPRWPAGQVLFGHADSRCVTNAWADPDRGVVFVYLTSSLKAGDLGVRHQCQVSDAILAACT